MSGVEKMYQSDLDVPETLPPRLLMPEGNQRALDMVVLDPKGPVTPIEMAWIITQNPHRLMGNYMILLHQMLSEDRIIDPDEVEDFHDGIVDCRWFNHYPRILARVAIDPRRHQRVNLLKTYQLDRGRKYSVPEEKQNLRSFYHDSSVVHRPDLED